MIQLLPALVLLFTHGFAGEDLSSREALSPVHAVHARSERAEGRVPSAQQALWHLALLALLKPEPTVEAEFVPSEPDRAVLCPPIHTATRPGFSQSARTRDGP